MFIALTLTLLLILTVLRHILEPTCPGCSAKSWSSDPSMLCCSECGWTNLATSSAAPEYATARLASAQFSSSQYEIGFH